MSRIEVTKSTGMPNVEAGVYLGTCVRVKDDTLDEPQFGDGNIVRLYLALDDVPDEETGEPIELDGMANRKISPKAKLTRWAEALGHPIDFDTVLDFDTEELVGGKCLVKIIRKDKDSWPKIEDLTARPKSGKAPAFSNPQPVADDTATFLKVDASGDPEVDWTAFWVVAKRHGINKKHVTDEAGKEPQDIDPFELPVILEKLIQKTKV